MKKNYLLRVMKIIMFILFAGFLSVSASGYSQQITLKGKDIPFSAVLDAVRSQSGFTIFSSKSLLDKAKPVTIHAEGMPVKAFLDKITEGQHIGYQLEDKMISLYPKRPQIVPVKSDAERMQPRFITGTVRDAGTREVLAGVTVQVKSKALITQTDAKGRFRLALPGNLDSVVLVFTFVGMEKAEMTWKDQKDLTVLMEADVDAIKDVVITGIYERKKESFTGSSSTYTVKDLQMVGNQNVLQSLKTLDPSFAITDNNIFGSDPNHLPDIEIRGKSSVIGLTDTYGSDPNQPLFILDGFESTLAIISDLSMDRVENITILKDAAATAIYGSKAANGVVVVETKRPEPGQLRMTYNLNSSVGFADLSDYNLMNAEEKLQFELLSGFYGTINEDQQIVSSSANEQKYYNRLKEVRRGVNSYWLNEPLRTALSQRHSIFAEGGDESLRYSASVNYGQTNGVMKASSRQTTGGNIRLLYRRGNVSFNNSLSIDYVKANRETVPFSRFARANPYHRKYNAEGGIDKVLESYTYSKFVFTPINVNIYNPLYDLSNNNLNQTESSGFTNNFELDWRVMQELRVRARFGIRRFTDRGEIFQSPFNTAFEDAGELEKGSYRESTGKQLNYDGDLSVTYGKLLSNLHMINAVAGMRVEQASGLQSAYEVRGFVDDNFSNPNFAYGYAQGEQSDYQESIRRGASFYMNTGYAYDQRYLFDATVRSDGSSIYGSSRQFTTIWSLGLGWNIHNEPFFKHSEVHGISHLRLRGSIGNPGNQNFDDYISARIYRYNNENRNPFGASVIMSKIGNRELQWQKTLERNIGLDLQAFNDRLRINLDYFVKNTDPLLIMLGLPSSNGFTTVPQNFGEQEIRGFTAIASYALLQQENVSWMLNVNMRQIKAEYQNMGSRLDNFNESNQSKNLIRYYDGGSPSDLWAVPSLGIDPASGREIFLNKNGQQTFVHSYDDEVVVGNSEPDLEGVIGTSFFYKGFSASVNLRYRLGGQVFMQTLYGKVENISNENVALNQDKRALYERWRKPGDLARFKAISRTEYTPMSSRFIQDNNQLIGESVSLGYETTEAPWLKTIGASSFRIRAYMNDIFHMATVTNERGIDYPFARSVSLSASIRF